MAKHKKNRGRAGKLQRQQARTAKRRERRAQFEAKQAAWVQAREAKTHNTLTKALTNASATTSRLADEAAKAAKIERQRVRNDRSAKTFERNIGLMMEGKPSAYKRKVDASTPFMGVAALYATEKYWRGREDGYQNWSKYAREGIAAEKGVNVRDVNLWGEVKASVTTPAYNAILDVMTDDGSITFDEYGRPTYKGKTLNTLDDVFQAALDTGIYSKSDLIAIIRSAVANVRWV